MAETGGEVKGFIEVKGKSFKIPEGAQILVVRAPADTEPEALDGLALSDLVEDDEEISKQIGIAYYAGEGKGYKVINPSKSFTLVDVPKEAKPPKIVRAERPPMIPPSGLKVSPLPYAVSKQQKKKSSKKQKKSSKSERRKEDKEEEAEEPAPPPKKKQKLSK